MQRNREINHKLVAKFNGTDFQRVATLYEVALVFTRRIAEGHSYDTGVDIGITPLDAKSYDFLSHYFRIGDNGLISSKNDFKDFKNQGFIFRATPFDEQAVAEAVAAHPWSSLQLQEALEAIDSVEKFL